jgi:hypothetical protein
MRGEITGGDGELITKWICKNGVHVESSGRGVVSPGGVMVRGRNTLRIQPGQTMRWLHSLDVPSRGPVHAATRWETRPTLLLLSEE